MSLLENLLSRLDGDALSKLSSSIGADERNTKDAVGAALPVLLGAITKQARSQEGAASLDAALSRDHDGGVLEQLGDLFQGGRNDKAGDGDGILRHLFGGKRSAVESGLSKSTGLDASTIGSLLPKLAPLVMGALGREKQKQGLGLEGLMGLLSKEEGDIEAKAPGMGGLLGSFLDQDGDGDLDLADAAKGLLGKLGL